MTSVGPRTCRSDSSPLTSTRYRSRKSRRAKRQNTIRNNRSIMLPTTFEESRIQNLASPSRLPAVERHRQKYNAPVPCDTPHCRRKARRRTTDFSARGNSGAKTLGCNHFHQARECLATECQIISFLCPPHRGRPATPQWRRMTRLGSVGAGRRPAVARLRDHGRTLGVLHAAGVIIVAAGHAAAVEHQLPATEPALPARYLRPKSAGISPH